MDKLRVLSTPSVKEKTRTSVLLSLSFYETTQNYTYKATEFIKKEVFKSRALYFAIIVLR